MPRSPDVRFSVRLIPRGGSDRVDGIVDGVLQARVIAPAVGGAANGSLLRLIAAQLGVAPSTVRLVAGSASRRKLVAIDGIDRAAVVARWPGLAV